MLQRIKLFFSRLNRKHTQKKSLQVRELRKLAEELTHLAEIASRINPEQKQNRNKLGKIKDEMNRLAELVESKDFTRLPRETKLELRENLLTSRQRLIKAIHHAPPPTDTLQ
ncbi:MAG: hypothetical protein R6X11_06335 [Desulfonatronovibrio sp.]